MADVLPPCTCRSANNPGLDHHHNCPVEIAKREKERQENLKEKMSLRQFSTHAVAPVRDVVKEIRPEDVRGETHGNYTEMAARIQDIKTTMRAGASWDKLSPGQAEALELIATKIGRIVTGDPHCHDHWADIAGYARLVHDRIGYKKG